MTCEVSVPMMPSRRSAETSEPHQQVAAIGRREVITLRIKPHLGIRIPAHGAVLAIIVHGHPARNGHAVTEFEGAVQRGAGPYSISEVPRVYDMDVRQRSARAVFGLPFAVGPFGGMKATFLVRAMAPVPARYPVDSNWSLPKFDVQEISTSAGCWSATVFVSGTFLPSFHK